MTAAQFTDLQYDFVMIFVLLGAILIMLLLLLFKKS